MDKERISRRLQPPFPKVTEQVVTFVKAIVGDTTIPWNGSASELIGMLFAPSCEKKIHNWRGVIADIVLELFNRKISL